MKVIAAGAGQAGLTAARELARAGAAVTINSQSSTSQPPKRLGLSLLAGSAGFDPDHGAGR